MGKVVVSGLYKSQLLPWLPNAESGDKGSGENREPGYHYPFTFGQRLNFMYLIARKGAKIEELADICQSNPRICQAAQLTLEQNKLASQLTQPGGWEPVIPVVAVGVSQDLVTSQVLKRGRNEEMGITINFRDCLGKALRQFGRANIVDPDRLARMGHPSVTQCTMIANGWIRSVAGLDIGLT